MKEEKEIPTARVNWCVSGNVECPKCEHDNDWMSQDEWWLWGGVGETKDFKHSYTINCEECGTEIKVTGSDY